MRFDLIMLCDNKMKYGDVRITACRICCLTFCVKFHINCFSRSDVVDRSSKVVCGLASVRLNCNNSVAIAVFVINDKRSSFSRFGYFTKYGSHFLLSFHFVCFGQHCAACNWRGVAFNIFPIIPDDFTDDLQVLRGRAFPGGHSRICIFGFQNCKRTVRFCQQSKDTPPQDGARTVGASAAWCNSEKSACVFRLEIPLYFLLYLYFFCFSCWFKTPPCHWNCAMMSPKTKRRMRAFHSPRRLDAKKNSHSPVCDSIFLGLSGQIFADMRSRPTKILKISAFRDFFVTEPKCQKGAKNRVKTRFLRRISILCSSYGGP